jgi:hypothetical protein
MSFLLSAQASRQTRRMGPCVEGAAKLIERPSFKGHVQNVFDILRWIVVAGSVVQEHSGDLHPSSEILFRIIIAHATFLTDE